MAEKKLNGLDKKVFVRRFYRTDVVRARKSGWWVGKWRHHISSKRRLLLSRLGYKNRTLYLTAAQAAGRAPRHSAYHLSHRDTQHYDAKYWMPFMPSVANKPIMLTVFSICVVMLNLVFCLLNILWHKFAYGNTALKHFLDPCDHRNLIYNAHWKLVHI